MAWSNVRLCGLIAESAMCTDRGRVIEGRIGHEPFDRGAWREPRPKREPFDRGASLDFDTSNDRSRFVQFFGTRRNDGEISYGQQGSSISYRKGNKADNKAVI